MRDPVVRPQVEARRPVDPEAVEGGQHRRSDEVALVGGHLARALTLDGHSDSGAADLDGDLVVPGQREPERIEPGPEVRARGGHAYAYHVRPKPRRHARQGTECRPPMITEDLTPPWGLNQP